METMKFGVRVPNLVLARYFPLNIRLDFRTVKEYTLRCEALGYDSVWVNDHLLFGEQILECWTTLSALSSVTEKIRLGTLVLCNSFRYPSVLAKMGATLDYISGGRLEFGIGAGWSEREHEAYGIAFPPPRERLARLKETLAIVKRLWTAETASFRGKYYTLKNAVCEPRPVQLPHPPILVGTTGEKALKIVAEYADKCNFSHKSPEQYRETLSLLNKHCQEIGRNPHEIEKTLWSQVVISEDNCEIKRQLELIYKASKPHEDFQEWTQKLIENNIIGSPEQCIDKVQEYEDLGVSLIIMRFGDAPSLEGLHLFGEKVAPVFQ